jgi:hypothetical protein
MLVNCRRCNKILAGHGIPLCSACAKAEQKLLKEIQAYLQKHPSASIRDVVGDMGLNVSRVKDMIRWGWLKVGK